MNFSVVVTSFRQQSSRQKLVKQKESGANNNTDNTISKPENVDQFTSADVIKQCEKGFPKVAYGACSVDTPGYWLVIKFTQPIKTRVQQVNEYFSYLISILPTILSHYNLVINS